MSNTPSDYPRVKIAADGEPQGVAPAGAARSPLSTHVRWFIIPLSMMLCAIQALITVTASNTAGMTPTSTLIAVIGFGFMFMLIMLFNPLKMWAMQTWRGRVFLLGGILMPILVWLWFHFVPIVIPGLVLGVMLIASTLLVIVNTVCRNRLANYGAALDWAGAAVEWLLIFSATMYLVYSAGSDWPVYIPLAVSVIASIFALVTWGQPALGRAELMSIIAAMIVTAGISTFGLSDQLVPLIPAPWNPEWNTPQRGWDNQILPHLNRDLYITDPDAVRVYREGLRKTIDGQDLKQPRDEAPVSEWIGFYRVVAVNLPWHLWLKPLGYWMIFVIGCYGMFYSLSYLVINYWSGREKLIFPLAKLPEALLPEEEDERQGRWLPAIFRSPLFWLGLTFSFLVLAYNGAAVVNWIPLAKVDLGMSGSAFKTLVASSFFEGLGASKQMSFLIVFTCIAIAFLLPLEISFSIWFYYLLGRFLLLALYRMGYRDYATDWMFAHDPVSSQGAGGVLIYSIIALYRSAREYVVLARGRSGKDRLRVLMPLLGLIVCIIVLTLWVQWNKVHFHWALVFVLFMALLTIGLMRIVAESGVFWMQAHASFFHFYKMVGMGKVFGATMVAPLLPIYSVLFLDIKTFIAPNMVNAAKMHEDVGGSRTKFHINIILSVAVSMFVAIFYSIIMAYGRGAQQMHNWFYSGAPTWFMEKAAWVTTMPAKFEAATSAWFASGAVWVALSMFLRRTLFWFPHPIGFIMNINPLMNYLWFSFFIGWVCKKIVVQYGGKASFDKVRKVMLGLIVGELVAIFIAGAITLFQNVAIKGIDLNRYGP